MPALGGTDADDAEHGAAALAMAEGDARHAADHVFKARDIFLRPCGLVGERLAIGWALEHLEGSRRIKAQVFRRAFNGDVAPRLDEAVDRDALFEMLAVVPAIEIGFMR